MPAAAHPLDALTSDEVSRAVAVITADPRFEVDAAFVHVRLHEPDKATVLGHEPGAPVDREVEALLVPPGRLEVTEVVVSVTKGEVRSWAVHPEHAARAALRRVDVGHHEGEGAPGVAGRAAAARHRRLRPRADRPVAGGIVRCRPRGRPADQPLHLLPAGVAAATTDTPNRSRASSRSSTRVRARCSRWSTSASCPCRPTGARTSPTTSGRCATTSSRWRSCSPTVRASWSTATTCAGRGGRSGSASTRTRASSCTPSATRTATGSGRCCTGRRSPRWSCPTATPARCTAGRTRSTPASGASAAWPTRSNSAATAWASSTTSTRCSSTEQGRALRGPERGVHPRGGLRDPLEAPRPARRHRRDAAIASAGRQLHRHRRQLRVRLLLVLLPRRQHPTGGEAHRDRVADGHRAR